MNLCRTCKYWARRAHMIGLGTCTNAAVALRVQPGCSDFLNTAQDFGCVLHEPGECGAQILAPAEVEKIIYEFVANTVHETLKK